MANQRSRRDALALFIAMRQLVLHGLPTTRTRTSLRGVFLDRLALADEDLAVDAEQILALHAGFAGTLPTSSAQFTPRNPSSRSAVATMPLSSGKRAVLEFHHHAIQRPSAGGISMRCSCTG